jgi:hypothetical protein
MITKDTIQDLLIEGRGIDSQQYFEHCGANHVKTFYFFCERLSLQPSSVALSSTELNQYIIAQLRNCGVSVHNQFNPQGWFGKAWTEWSDPSRNQTNFKNEYCEILIRIGGNPYCYQIRSECLGDVVEIFDEFRSVATV